MSVHPDLTESISGSEASTASDPEASTSDVGSDREDTHLTRLLRKQHLTAAAAASAAHRSPGGEYDAAEEEEDLDVLAAGPRTALQWFEAPRVAPETQYGVYRAALPLAGARKRPLPGAEEGQAVLRELQELQLRDTGPSSAAAAEPGQDQERKWTLLMFGGGHFAGMVVSLRPKLVKSSKKGSKDKEREVVVLHKKTFHRYTSASPGSRRTSPPLGRLWLIPIRLEPAGLASSSSQAGRLARCQRLGQRESKIRRSPDPAVQRGDAD